MAAAEPVLTSLVVPSNWRALPTWPATAVVADCVIVFADAEASASVAPMCSTSLALPHAAEAFCASAAAPLA